MEEVGIVGQLLQPQGGKQGEDRRAGKNRNQDYQEKRIILALAELAIEAVCHISCAELEAPRPRTGGAHFQRNEGVRWCTKEKNGAGLKRGWEVEFVKEKSCAKSQSTNEARNKGGGYEHVRLFPDNARNPDRR